MLVCSILQCSILKKHPKLHLKNPVVKNVRVPFLPALGGLAD